MNSRTYLNAGRVLATLSLIFFLAACDSDSHSGHEAHDEQMNWEAPPFETTDAAGNTLRYPHDLEGPTIVLFWATWCPYCKSLMPHLQSVVDEYGGEVEVIALNFREDDDPAEFLAEYGYDFRLIPEADDIAETWGVKSTPGLFLVDGDGMALFSNYALRDEEYPSRPSAGGDSMKHYQKASRRAPYWAARLRQALDQASH